MNAKNVKVLLLEDDAAHAEAIQRTLKATRYKVRVAGTLREYHDSVAADKPDIALLDMFLPDGVAMEVLSSHQQANSFPLLIMTSHGNEQNAVAAMKAGALDYIIKSPEAFADMPGIITRALDHWKLLQERKWGEEELRKSEIRYRDLVNNSKNAVVIYEAAADGEDFIIKDFNSAAENIEKVKKEDIIGKSVLFVFPGVKEYGFFEVFQRVWRTGVPERYPSTQYRDDRISGWRDSYVYRLFSGEIVAIYEDVTARKLAEEALQREKLMLARTEGIAHIGSWEWDIATDTVTWSDELFRIFQRDQQEGAPGFAGHPALYHPDDFELLRQAVEAAVARGVPYELELRAIRKDGETRVCMAYGVAEMGLSGQTVRLVGSLQDITDRKQVEKALRETEEKHRAVIDMASDGIVVIQDGILRFSNPRLTDMLGYGLGEIIGRTLASFIPRDKLDLVLERYRKRMAGEKLSDIYEMTLLHKSGREIPVETNGSIILYDGKPADLAVIRDITERKEAEEALQVSEQKYHNLIELLHEGIWAIDEDSRTTYVNSHMAGMLGYTVEEMQGKELFSFMDERGRELAAQNVERRREGISETHGFEFLRKDGQRIYASLSTTPVTGKDGKYKGAIAGVQDITAQRRLEEERQRVDKLESIGLLAGGIAHDFNNILTSILGNISLAGMEAAPGSELQNSLEQAEKATLRAKDLTVQLLTFSKGGAPVMKLSSLTELLKDTAKFALHGSRVKCRFSIPADLWHAEIDTGQVSQVIHNLVINARQAMPAGGTIEVLAENMTLNETQSLGRGLPVTSGDYVRIAVMDHGTGIPAEHLEKIFDPFFTTKEGGNGLGLATSFSIARNHGGHISVESVVGDGSTFYLYLPASTEMAAPTQARTVARKTAVKARILVMDDEQGIRDIAGRMLKHLGYEDVEFASDGAEAIKLYKGARESGHPFDVAIFDLTIAGGMGGEVAMQKLLKIDPGVKAIVSSGYIDDSVIAKFRDHGFSGVVAKPYTLEELRKAVQDVIG